MKRVCVATIGIVFTVPQAGAQAGGFTTVSGDGWSVTAVRASQKSWFN